MKTKKAAWPVRAFRAALEWGSREWTVLILPHTGQKTRDLRINQFVLFSAIGLSVVLLLGAALWLTDFTVQAKEMTRLATRRTWQEPNRKAFAAEQARLEKEIFDFRRRMAQVTPLLPDSWQRSAGIGGRELSLSELSAGLRAWQESRPSDAGLEEQGGFLRDTADLSKQLGKYVQKRQAFFQSFPTLYPVLRGAGEVTREPGTARSLQVRLPAGTMIVASGDGTVAWSRQDERGLGMIRIDHGYGFFTEYRGLSRSQVVEKDKVKRGVAIGRSSAEFTYYVQVADTWVDPLLFSTISAI